MPTSASSPPPLSDKTRWFHHYAGSDGLLSQQELVSALVLTFDSSSSSSSSSSIASTVAAIWPAFDMDGSGSIDEHEFRRPGGMGEALLAAAVVMQREKQQQQQQSQTAPAPKVSSWPSVYVPSQEHQASSPACNVVSTNATTTMATATPTSDDFFICPKCTFVNKVSQPSCKACGFGNPSCRPITKQQQQQQHLPNNTPLAAAAVSSAPSWNQQPYVPYVPQQQQLYVPQQQQQQDDATAVSPPAFAPIRPSPVMSPSHQPPPPPPPPPPPRPPAQAPVTYVPQQQQLYVPQQQQQQDDATAVSPPAFAPIRPSPVMSPSHQPPPPPRPPAQAPVNNYSSSSTATPTSNHVRTFRVLIPNGMQPGQCIRVQTGVEKAGSTIVATIPPRNEWGRSASSAGSVGATSGQWYFDLQVLPNGKCLTLADNGASGPTTPATSSSSGITNHSAQQQQQPPSRPSPSQHVQQQRASPNIHQTTSHTTAHDHVSSSLSAPTRHHTAVLAPQHISSTARTLVLKERAMSYSGDDASIKDASTGNIIFSARAELMTFSQRRFLVDTRGAKVGQLRHKKMPGLHPTVYIGTVSDEKKFAIRMSGMLNPMNCNAKILLGSDTANSKVIGTIVGNWRAKTFSISTDGSVIAKVKRKRTASSIFMGADTYCIDVEAGVDLAFVTLVAIALDELYNDDRGGRQGGGGIGGSFGPGW